MGLQDETRMRVWLAAISPLPKNQQIFGDPDRPHAKLVRLILSKCGEDNRKCQLIYKSQIILLHCWSFKMRNIHKKQKL